ncbi:MAG TPA: DNA topoisomerase IB [Solirubrobacteraceae bacterium]|nr:DNA topoisomerase IB [Solirubrobacteraceae bacterium]
MPRLRRSDCSAPGIARRRRGRGFEFLDPDGARVDDPETLERIAALAIPPAWRDVWICLDPLGHLQATGIDAAGRKQYRYHDHWRTRRDREKYGSMIEFGNALPKLRRRVTRDLRADSELTERRVLACATRLLDLGFFRIGSEDYAVTNESYGLATMLKRHVTIERDEVVFDYPGKSGQRRFHAIADDDVREIVAELKRRRGGGPELLAYRNGGRRWVDVRSEDINAYVKAVTSHEFSAKDFRTWNATVLAAIAVAADPREPASGTAYKRIASSAVKTVAVYLGNTPAVARASYIDPRVFDRLRSGWTIADTLAEVGAPDLANPRKRTRIEAAVLDVLEGE